MAGGGRSKAVYPLRPREKAFPLPPEDTHHSSPHFSSPVSCLPFFSISFPSRLLCPGRPHGAETSKSRSYVPSFYYLFGEVVTLRNCWVYYDKKQHCENCGAQNAFQNYFPNNVNKRHTLFFVASQTCTKRNQNSSKGCRLVAKGSQMVAQNKLSLWCFTSTRPKVPQGRRKGAKRDQKGRN